MIKVSLQTERDILMVIRWANKTNKNRDIFQIQNLGQEARAEMRIINILRYLPFI